MGQIGVGAAVRLHFGLDRATTAACKSPLQLNAFENGDMVITAGAGAGDCVEGLCGENVHSTGPRRPGPLKHAEDCSSWMAHHHMGYYIVIISPHHHQHCLVAAKALVR